VAPEGIIRCLLMPMDPERFEQVEALYNAVLARKAEERSALLDQAEPEVRREVELMLAQQGSVLDWPAWHGAASLLETQTRVSVGRQLGPYRIEQLQFRFVTIPQKIPDALVYVVIDRSIRRPR
jgi:hypothetical protein